MIRLCITMSLFFVETPAGLVSRNCPTSLGGRKGSGKAHVLKLHHHRMYGCSLTAGLEVAHHCTLPDEVPTCSDSRLSMCIMLTAVTNFSFSGSLCELYKDPCVNINCQNGGTCDSEGLNATCICAPGYAGK